MTTTSEMSFKLTSTKKRFKRGDLVIYDPPENASILIPSKSYIVLVEQDQEAVNVFTGTVVWTLMSETHPIGRYHTNWGPSAFRPFRGTITLESDPHD